MERLDERKGAGLYMATWPVRGRAGDVRNCFTYTLRLIIARLFA